MTGALIGHEEFKDLWSAAVLWNPVLDMTYNLNATDIPDWNIGCALGKELDFSNVSAEDRATLYERSPISYVHRVKTPSLFLIGDSD